MKSRRIIVGAALLCIGVLALVLNRHRSGEPKFDGKTLTELMLEEHPGGFQPPHRVVRSLGTNAIPALLRMLCRTNSSPPPLGTALLYEVGLISYPAFAERDNWFAEEGFGDLGRDASNALPALIRIYHQKFSKQSQISAVHSIGRVGSFEEVNAFMRQVVTNSDVKLASSAFYYLAPASTPETSLPFLIEAITNPASRFPKEALSMLRKFKTNAVPALLTCVATPGRMNYQAKELLCDLDPGTAAKILTNEPYTFAYFKNMRASSGRRAQTRFARDIQNFQREVNRTGKSADE
jgi:hypothetical protein